MLESTVHKNYPGKLFSLSLLLVITGLLGVCTNSFADTKKPEISATEAKMTAEAVFIQGQQYLEQGNPALAEVSLTRIPPASPYAKLLAGNIAAAKGDTDRAFLLLLPLQSNTSLINPAAASLHASLGNAYEKQGDSVNALAQLISRETYITGPATDDNHQNIWRLLSSLPAPDLIAIRGEAADTTIQGWVDLSLAAKNPDMATELATWLNSYPDHPAAGFAKTLSAVKSANTKASGLTLPGNIALILPFDNPEYADKANAFKMGLQAALDKNAIPNTIKAYASLGDTESFGDLSAFAKDEQASYVIGPMQASELSEQLATVKTDEKQADIRTLSLLDSRSTNGLQNAGFSLQDEAEAIAAFAKTHAIQHITILATDNGAAKSMTEAFQAVWADQGNEARVITLPSDVQKASSSLLDLRANLAQQPLDMILLAMSGDEARAVRPFLDISTPTLAYSSINNDSSNSILNAVRFVDIPFLLDPNNSQYAAYQKLADNLATPELKRWFALGVDTLQLLIADPTEPNGTMINGATGKLLIDQNGKISRQLPLGRFTYSGWVLDN